MFKYTGSQTSTSMSNTLLKKANGKESKLKKKRLFGSPPPASGHSRQQSGRWPTLPRSRSCQCTARLKSPAATMAQPLPTASSMEPIDRRWWLEPADIPAIDGPNGNGANGEWLLAQQPAEGRQARFNREKPKQPTMAQPNESVAVADSLHALLLVPMLSNGSLSASCCSDSPCSSSSLAIPGLLDIDEHFDDALVNHCHQNGGCHHRNNNGHSLEEDAIVSTKEKWPSAEELARCLSRLFPSLECSPSQQEVLTQLLCLRPFISPPELLHKLLQHTMFVQHASAANFSKDSQRRLFDHVLAFCGHWVRSLPYDFRTQQIRDRLLAVLALSGAQKDPIAQQLCDELLAELRVQMSRLERYEQAIHSLEPQLEKNWEKRWETPGGLLALGRPAMVVAQQLTHIELERLSMVGLDELVQMLSRVNSLDQLGQTAPPGCVRHYVQWFNQLSQLAASEMLRHQHKRHRAKCADFLLEVARECLALGNFNSLAAIVAGLCPQPVARLRRTWARVEKGRLEVLQRQLDPTGNFSAYRASLKAAIWAAKRPALSSALTPMVIPFFGLLLKDAFLLFRQCRLPGPGGHLNRMAMEEFGELMGQLGRWKATQCHFPRVGPVLQHLLLSPLLAERSMFLLSYGYEAPENSADREQFRRFAQANLQEKNEENNGGGAIKQQREHSNGRTVKASPASSAGAVEHSAV